MKLATVIIVLIIIPLILLGNFALMVVLGAIGHVFDVPKLALSFWQTLIVYAALWLIGGFFRSNE